MELIDYIKFRWKLMTALLVLGLLAIAFVGSRSGPDTYAARAELLVRPPASELSSYASDLDRYIDTEMTLVFNPENLEKEAEGTALTPEELGAALTFTHEPGSETVVMQVTDPDPEVAVEAVNATAQSYIQQSRQRFLAPSREEAADLQQEIDDVQQELASVSQTIGDAAQTFIEENPDAGAPQTSVLTPEASVRQSVLTGRLQQLYQQQSELESSADSISRSSVSRPATVAVMPPGWDATTYVAATIGVLLLLLTFAGVAFALSNRVLGQGRWGTITRDSTVRRPIRLRGLTTGNRDQTVRRVSASLASVGRPDGQTLVVFLPRETKGLKRRAAFLMKGLADGGFSPREVGSVAQLAAELDSQTSPQGGEPDPPRATRVLLLVDLAQSKIDDVGILADYPDPVQRLIVPVLV